MKAEREVTCSARFPEVNGFPRRYISSVSNGFLFSYLIEVVSPSAIKKRYIISDLDVRICPHAVYCVGKARVSMSFAYFKIFPRRNCDKEVFLHG